MTEALHQHIEQSKVALLLAGVKDEISDLKKEIGKQKDLGPTKLEKQVTPCPFPDHKGYSEVWEKLTPDQQKYMKENIKITSDGKVEIVKMKKKFSVLTATPNNKDVFDGSYVDKEGKTGIKGVTYFEGESADLEAKHQGKKFLKDYAEAKKFTNLFPGPDRKGNFLELFGLKNAGTLYLKENLWSHHGNWTVECVRLLEVGQENGLDAIWVVSNSPGYLEVRPVFYKMDGIPIPTIVFEPVNPLAGTTTDQKAKQDTQKVKETKAVDKIAPKKKITQEGNPVEDFENKPAPKPKSEEEQKPETTTEKVLKPDTNKSDMFMMPDGKRYSYDELIKNYPILKNDTIFKQTFPGRERPKD